MTEAVTVSADPPATADFPAAVAAILQLAPAGRVLLICHVSPDGDALGSMLGFGLGLRRLGVSQVQATFPGPFEIPEPFAELPGLDLLVGEEQAEPRPDLVIVFDVAAESRLGALADRLPRARATVSLDHHASHTGFAGVNLVDPGAAATAVVAEELLNRLDVPLDVEIAECLYVALATDTGSFRFDMTTPRVHEMAARLIATGLRPGDISRRVFDSRPFGAMKLSADVLGRAQLDPTAAGGHGMVWTYATLEDLERHGQRPYVLDALIDPVRCVAEVDVSVVVKQLAEREWAVSLRSKGAVDVSAVAVALGGGGHRLAAGFTGYGAPGEVVTAVRDELPRHLIG
ncbi:bifunctional oligoribonuclease/PAP phosphatase NrnA [Amorphoplanes nipponensis]|uniref:Bifunctional oligoribonuclease and PAP phosphatase NrnA n=1 Tax=Actinoplanes nipponensis TaxID=135950 RepID=A0A919MQ50_9ACTN|nr:DHH family phosphoesterase [Actinoplanes nipponensis]GIE53286.1 bifunctional oligoribonuclease and PAP phosphatase NrnA [Actinoplanes nipponensis]